MHGACTDKALPDAQQLQIPLEIKASEGGGTALGTFEGYGSVFGNRDRDGDVVERGAFAESLKAGLPALLWQHDQKSPIGRFDVVREDKRGLYVKGQLSMKGRGAEAYDLLKMGALNGLSIGFVTKEASRDAASGARTIMKADLMEVSLVTFPANELARVEAVKSQRKEFGTMENTEGFNDNIADVRSFERMLRDNGFSRSRAKAITAKGFKAIGFDADESAEIAEMVEALKGGQLQLEEKGFRERFQLLAPPLPLRRWGKWYRLKGITSHPTRPSSFEMKFTSVADLPGPFEIEVSYVGPTGKKTDKLLSPSSAKFQLPLNAIQEPQVRARSLTINGQLIRVLKFGS